MSKQVLERVGATIAVVPHFPKDGIMFRDISGLLASPQEREEAFDLLYQAAKDKQIDAVAGMDARGFIFGLAVAERLKKPFIMIRKPSKLPNSIALSYELEYGSNTLEIQKEATQGKNVWIVDDLLATGGTALAACQLVEMAGGKVAGTSFLVELDGLPGRSKLEAKGYSVHTVLNYDVDSTTVVPK
ncbi:adenine phosphoribosyltransferase [Acrasis kona]|uniref:adenine phosphoribosyltransferase n=1 Tax=Acrasis kona TaxID=1008807 RepID=A0AAW2YHZ4_9EUKA